MQIILIFVLTGQALFVLGISSILILGEPIQSIFRHKSPLSYYFKMVVGVFMISPRRVVHTVSWNVIISAICWIMVDDVAFWSMVSAAQGIESMIYDFIIVSEAICFIAAGIMAWALRHKIEQEAPLRSARQQAYYRIYREFNMQAGII